MKLEEFSELIPFDNPITRAELKDLSHLSDRLVRKLIEKLRETSTDYVIVSRSQGKGYYKTTDPAKITEYINEQTRRAKKILWNLKTAKQFLGEKDQLKIIWE